MNKLGNYITGRWITGDGDGKVLYDAVTGDDIAIASTEGLDFASILDYGRRVGNPALRGMTFHERGRMLRALAVYLNERKEKFYQVSYKTGATKVDSWIDIEGGFGNLFSNASLRRKFPDLPYCTDGDPVPLSKAGTFIGHHILVPKEGVAIHINAFNFPVWGMLEKCAVNWLAGVPAVVKPATITSFLTEEVVKEIIASGILPEGALQLICGSAGDLLDHVMSQDVITFTGSKATGLKLRANPKILAESVPFNMEADSLNAIVLGEDVDPSMPEWDIFIKEIRKEMTVKAGQKCTAIRRIFVPENKMEETWKAIASSLKQTTIGNPLNEKVRMGPLAGQSQRQEVKQQVQKLLATSQIIYGSLDSVEVIDADAKKGAFISPILLKNEKPFTSDEVHEIEVFGPASTIMPYRDLQEAIQLSKKGKGSLCSTIVTADDNIAADYVVNAGTHHGRILVLNAECAKESTGHGSPLPMLVHGGPGRAGGGEEMGGMRGVKHYMQRVAIQGSPTTITGLLQKFPCVMGSFLSAIDMQSGSPSFGGPESVFGLYASGQIARHYYLPWRAGGGTLTASQGSMRRLRTIPKHAAGGLHGGGQRRVPVGGLARRAARGLLREVRSRHRAPAAPAPAVHARDLRRGRARFSAHAEIGPGGYFLGAEHTLEGFRECFWRPALVSTENFERWRRNGSHDARDRAGVLWREGSIATSSRRWTRPCTPS